MKTCERIASTLCVVAALALSMDAFAASGGPVVEGQILSYECGDNCYLTIRTTYGKEIAGLCAAPECESWNERAEMPAKFRGRRVSVAIDKGARFDGNLEKVDDFPAFSKLRFLK